ncbi:response regulator transcription factor [Oricola cellulosilytica]|uniref:Response regulator transcription factor n=1 Tax=Oricola cellulosilytica TaxID=1429082 RepID=A0A4R0P8A3_9HYPH|nr:response regulator transcription factor [Oricola cellulosilytica]TCD13302.1 response regulator transcription factor [Oricola cellulosilytica]
MRIAIVEDNRPLAGGIAKAFEAEGHGVDLLHVGTGAADFLLGEKLDLIILDVNLPGCSGLEILESLRGAGNHAPVILLTARDAIEDKVSGLDLGADDYLTKPFELAELLARARALLRRADKEIATTSQLGRVVIDSAARQVSVDGAVIDLPRREFALLEALMSSRGGVVSKTQILDHLYGTGAEVEESAVELYVHRLRKKLAGSGTEIKTVRGLGYCLRSVA